jgi:hypothetical protein
MPGNDENKRLVPVFNPKDFRLIFEAEGAEFHDLPAQAGASVCALSVASSVNEFLLARREEFSGPSYRRNTYSYGRLSCL